MNERFKGLQQSLSFLRDGSHSLITFLKSFIIHLICKSVIIDFNFILKPGYVPFVPKPESATGTLFLYPFINYTAFLPLIQYRRCTLLTREGSFSVAMAVA